MIDRTVRVSRDAPGRALPATGSPDLPAGLDESDRGRHRTSGTRAGMRTAAAAALFSLPTGGLAAAVLAPQLENEPQDLRADLAASSADLGSASMTLDRAPASYAPVAPSAPSATSGSDIVNAQVVEAQKLPSPEKEVADPTMDEGTRTVVDPGREGERSVIWRVTYDKGKEVGRERIAAGQDTPATPKVVKVGTRKKVEETEKAAEKAVEKSKAEAPAVSGGATWDKLAECESGGDWSTNSGNGYYGGLQFDKQTWNAYGGDEFASRPDQASREEQIAVANKMKDERGGYGAWPSCSSKVGLS